MYRVIVVLFSVCAFLTACDNGDDPATLADPLIGTWIFEDTSNGCETAYTFRVDGTFGYTSLDEVESGTYTLETIEGLSEVYFLQMAYLEDAGLPDCDGDSDIDLNPFFIDIEFPSENTLNWLRSGEVVATFNRDVDVDE